MIRFSPAAQIKRQITRQTPTELPNGGYNVNSDASIVRRTSTTLLNANTGLDSGLAAEGGPPLGPADVTGPAMLTLALLGGPAAQFIPGVAGITFPAVDELLQPRGSPASAGAFEFAPITLTTNSSPPTITSQPVGETNAVGTSATFTVSARRGDDECHQLQPRLSMAIEWHQPQRQRHFFRCHDQQSDGQNG